MKRLGNELTVDQIDDFFTLGKTVSNVRTVPLSCARPQKAKNLIHSNPTLKETSDRKPEYVPPYKRFAMVDFYHPQTKLREGNVFTPVCDSVHGGGGRGVGGGLPLVWGGTDSTHNTDPLGPPPWADTPCADNLRADTPPPGRHPPG